MYAVVIVDAFGMMWLSGDIRFRKLRPKTCRFHQTGGRDVGLDERPPNRARITSEAESAGSLLPADDALRASVPGCDWSAPNCLARSTVGFASLQSVSATRTWGEPYGVGSPSVKSSTPTRRPCLQHPQDTAAHSQLGVIRVRCDY